MTIGAGAAAIPDLHPGLGLAALIGAPWTMGKVIAMQATPWNVDIEFDEDDTHTHANATARVRDGAAMAGRGDAYRNPSDSNQPLVGEEIAAARALIDLGTQLLQTAAAQIEQVTHEPAHLVR
jgi:hypothetical protein